MKRKLTRASIDELRKEMPVLSVEESKKTIGGGHIYIIDEITGRIMYSSSNTSDTTIIAMGSIDSGNIIRLDGSVRIDPIGGGKITEGSHVITGDGVNRDLYKFLCQGTNVEWGIYENSYTGNTLINTSHQYTHVDRYSFGPASPSGGGYDVHAHNHKDSYEPSDTDKESAKDGIYDEYIYYEKNDSYYYYGN